MVHESDVYSYHVRFMSFTPFDLTHVVYSGYRVDPVRRLSFTISNQMHVVYAFRSSNVRAVFSVRLLACRSLIGTCLVLIHSRREKCRSKAHKWTSTVSPEQCRSYFFEEPRSSIPSFPLRAFQEHIVRHRLLLLLLR